MRTLYICHYYGYIIYIYKIGVYKPTAAECRQRPNGGNNQRKFVRGPIKVFIDRSFKHQLKKMKRISIKYYTSL